MNYRRRKSDIVGNPDLPVMAEHIQDLLCTKMQNICPTVVLKNE